MTSPCLKYFSCCLLLLLAVSFLTSGCIGTRTSTAATETATSQTPDLTAETTASAAETSGSSKPEAASGVLRLWWSKHQSLNPLLDNTESGKAVNHLIYQGLYEIDGQQQANPILLASLTRQGENCLIRIKLKAGQSFHDGRPVTADDVVACINFIKEKGILSPYASSLASIARISAIDSLTLEIFLNQPDPWLEYALTFPIIPKDSLAADPMAMVPGTGSFRMVSYSSETGLLLRKNQAAGEISELLEIQVAEYGGLAEAMKAFENDRIDLVSLPAEEYSRYKLRNSLRFEQYTANSLLILAYNTQKGDALADTDRLLFLKQLMTPESIAAAAPELGGENADIPLPAASWRLAGEVPDYQVVLGELGQPGWKTFNGELVLLLPADDNYRLRAGKAIGSLLDRQGIAWRLETLPAAEYWAALNTGNYDLTILDAVMPDAPDASWLYLQNPPAAYAALVSITGGGLDDYNLWQQRLVSSGQDSGQLANLIETAARSPWSVILIRSAAVLYGDRIIGQCQPDRYNPYRGIEEIWVWSGQSS